MQAAEAHIRTGRCRGLILPSIMKPKMHAEAWQLKINKANNRDYHSTPKVSCTCGRIWYLKVVFTLGVCPSPFRSVGRGELSRISQIDTSALHKEFQGSQLLVTNISGKPQRNWYAWKYPQSYQMGRRIMVRDEAIEWYASTHEISTKPSVQHENRYSGSWEDCGLAFWQVTQVSPWE